jgi:hypothetical protein
MAITACTIREGSADIGTCLRFTRAGINAVNIGASIVTRGTACLPTDNDSIRLLIVTAAGGRPARRGGAAR